MPEMSHEDRGGQGPLPGNGDSPTPSADPAAATAASGDTGSEHIHGTGSDGAAREPAADENRDVTTDAASQGKDLHAARDTAGESAAKAGIVAAKAL
jgi:hypothetical protein